jgi:phospholipase/lecithinase/hemolysin
VGFCIRWCRCFRAIVSFQHRRDSLTGQELTSITISTALHHDWTVPLVNQTQQFLTWIEPEFRKDPSLQQQENALVAIWIGINDIGDTSVWTNVSFPVLYDEIISTVFTESAEPIYEAGYRNFLFINLPPLDRTPLNVVKTDPRPNKTMIEWWDGTLQEKTQAFSAQYKDTNTFLYDANTFLNHILDNPSEYGIKNTTGYCPGYLDPDEVTDPGKYGCIPIDEYFWFNTGHM